MSRNVAPVGLHSSAGAPAVTPQPVRACRHSRSRACGHSTQQQYSNGLNRHHGTFPAPPRAPPHVAQRHVCQAAKGDAPQAALDAGSLVVFSKGHRHELGLVLGPDGKKNLWIQGSQAGGRRSSLPSKSVVLVLPGSGYTADSLQAFEAAAEAGADASLLEIAWAVASEGPRPSYSLPDLCELLFDSTAAQQQYTAFVLLLQDTVYFSHSFKGGSWAFQPNNADAVAAAAAAAEGKAAEAAAQQAFLADWSAAVAAAARARPADVQQERQRWLAGHHRERVQALLDLALKPADGPPKPSAPLARDTLSLLKRRPEPDVAASVLLEAGLLRLHEPLPVLRLGLRTDGSLPPTLEAAAQALLASPPPDADAATRADLTTLRVYTIDDASTTEVDDGVSVERDAQGRLLLWVHVADPTRWLSPGDALELEARARTRTLYWPFGAAPMFPKALAEGPFSLTPAAGDGVCDALSICVTLTDEGGLEQLVQVTPSRIRVTHQLTYDEADADLALGPDMCEHPDLQLLCEASRLRRAWRVSQGCIDIDTFEAKLQVGERQLDLAAPQVTCTRLSQWESAARTLVAEMMILVGEAVGRLGAAEGLPLPYRGQEAPTLPPDSELAALPEGPVRGFALRRCMTRSVVQASPVPHASLGLAAYVQVTSPIRRHTDLLAHFNIKAHLRGAPLPFSAADITSITTAGGDASRVFGRAEGEVTRYWAAEYLRQHWARLQQRQRSRRLAATSASSGQEERQEVDQQQQQQAQQQAHKGDAEAGGITAMVLGWARQQLNLAAITLEQSGLECAIKVDFAAEPGERLLLQLLDVDVRTGFYRLAVLDRLDHDRSAAGLVELVAEGEESSGSGDSDGTGQGSDVLSTAQAEEGAGAEAAVRWRGSAPAVAAE